MSILLLMLSLLISRPAQAVDCVAILVVASDALTNGSHNRAVDFFRRGCRVIEVKGSRHELNQEGIARAFQNAGSASEIIVEMNCHGGAAGLGESGTATNPDSGRMITYTALRQIIENHQNRPRIQGTSAQRARITVLANSCHGGYLENSLRGVPGVHGYYASNGDVGTASVGGHDAQGETIWMTFSDLMRQNLAYGMNWDQAYERAVHAYSRARGHDRANADRRRAWNNGLRYESTSSAEGSIVRWCQLHPPGSAGLAETERRRSGQAGEHLETLRESTQRLLAEVAQDNDSTCSQPRFRAAYSASLQRLNQQTIQGIDAGIRQLQQSLGRLTQDSRGEQFLRTEILPRLPREAAGSTSPVAFSALQRRLQQKWSHSLTLLQNCRETYGQQFQLSSSYERNLQLHSIQNRVDACSQSFEGVFNDPEAISAFDRSRPQRYEASQCNSFVRDRPAAATNVLEHRLQDNQRLYRCLENAIQDGRLNPFEAASFLVVEDAVSYVDSCPATQDWITHLRNKMLCLNHFRDHADQHAWDDLENLSSLGQGTYRPRGDSMSRANPAENAGPPVTSPGAGAH